MTPPEPVETRDLTAAIHAAFAEANGECVHFERGFGPYAQCEDPGESVPVRWLASILAALGADTARVPEGLDVDGFLAGVAARPQLNPAWRDGIEYARLALAREDPDDR